jgi:hypothetical protein
MTPINALIHRATTRPNGTAFIYDDVVWTCNDLLTGAEQLSRAFLARGVRAGDRVVIQLIVFRPRSIWPKRFLVQSRISCYTFQLVESEPRLASGEPSERRKRETVGRNQRCELELKPIFS